MDTNHYSRVDAKSLDELNLTEPCGKLLMLRDNSWPTASELLVLDLPAS